VTQQALFGGWWKSPGSTLMPPSAWGQSKNEERCYSKKMKRSHG